MTRLSATVDWCIDVLMDWVALALFLGAWTVGVAVLFIVAPWWAGIIGLVLGVPFLLGLRSVLLED